MGIKIFWTDFAKGQLRQIFGYHKEKVSLKIARQIVSGIVNEAKILSNDPELGQIEDLLKERRQNFRCLIFSNYKIVYWINNEKQQIEVADVFDTRQNPVKIKRKK